MRATWLLILAACGDDGATMHPDAMVGMACQVDADCGEQFCTANHCTARPMWNAPQKLGGGVFLDGENQSGVSARGDNLELVFVTNRGAQCADLWHAQRASATADFDPAVALANVNDPTLCDKWPTMRGDGLELYWDRASMTGFTGAVMLRATRASTNDNFSAPQATAIYTDMFSAGQTLSGDGLTMLYEVAASSSATIPIYATTRASTSDPFATGTVRSDLGTVAALGLSLSPDGRYLVTLSSQYRLEVRIASASGTFGAPMPITELDAAAFDNQPSITPDGRTLYFSRRTTNLYDIWFATRR